MQQLGTAATFVFFATGLMVDPVADAGLAHEAGRAMPDGDRPQVRVRVTGLSDDFTLGFRKPFSSVDSKGASSR
jgi:hypothetical protein